MQLFAKSKKFLSSGFKTNLVNLLGASYVSHFKAVFCVRIVAVCEIEVVLALNQFNNIGNEHASWHEFS